MQFDQYPVGKVCTRIVPKNMPAANKKQLLAAGIEESTGIGEMLLVLEGRYPGDGQQQRINHFVSDGTQRSDRLLKGLLQSQSLPLKFKCAFWGTSTKTQLLPAGRYPRSQAQPEPCERSLRYP